MQIVIVGAGAIGSVYAALLADAGHEVWAIDTWAEHIAAINAGGLRLAGASGDRVVRTFRATTDIAEAGPCDLCLIATKASGVAAAAQAAAPAIRPDAVVLTIQNGLGAGERICRHIAPDRVLLGVTDGFGASIVAPGHAHHNAMKLIRIGELADGMTERLQSLETLWRGAGFDARAYANINQLIWEKFLCNVTFSVPCTVFGMTVGELMAHPERWAIALGAMAEAHRIAQASAVPLGFDDPVAYVTAFGAAMPRARRSMLLDHMAGRRSELEAINGILPEMGLKLGIATPFNDTLTAVLRQREAGFGGPPS
ncbi:MAG: 2-dehydropantoate 2-reductase [Rhodobacteraceae bacterium]|nr:2-dehydropantoate 2-reductase [Paracoccaceae bacterium]